VVYYGVCFLHSAVTSITWDKIGIGKSNLFRHLPDACGIVMVLHIRDSQIGVSKFLLQLLHHPPIVQFLRDVVPR